MGKRNYTDIEIACPHCDAAHQYRVPECDPDPWDDICDQCAGRYTVDPEAQVSFTLSDPDPDRVH